MSVSITHTPVINSVSFNRSTKKPTIITATKIQGSDTVLGIDFSKYRSNPVPKRSEISLLYLYSLQSTSIPVTDYEYKSAQKFIGATSRYGDKAQIKQKVVAAMERHYVHLVINALLAGSHQYFKDPDNVSSPKAYKEWSTNLTFLIRRYKSEISSDKKRELEKKAQTIYFKIIKSHKSLLKHANKINNDQRMRGIRVKMIKKILTNIQTKMPYGNIPEEILTPLKKALQEKQTLYSLPMIPRPILS
jgi:hypothetical protein